MFATQKFGHKCFSYQEITDFRYFRNMISILISHLYFDIILFNKKILIVLDSCFRSSFFILWVIFLYFSVFVSTALSNLKNYSMFISGLHHQIMSGSLILKELFKIDFNGCLQESSPSSSCIIVLENCMNNALNIIRQKIVRSCWKYGLCLIRT